MIPPQLARRRPIGTAASQGWGTIRAAGGRRLPAAPHHPSGRMIPSGRCLAKVVCQEVGYRVKRTRGARPPGFPPAARTGVEASA
jgi:hypothetical protein